MLRKKYLRLLSCLLSGTLSSLLFSPAAADTIWFKGGHLKLRLLANTLADDSLLLDYVDTPMSDQNGDLRLLFDWRKNKTSLVSDYQLIAQHGDSIILANNFSGSVIISDPIASDDNRLFDLSRVISENNNSTLTHRLDRLYLEYAETAVVARLGRQAISWGNGLIYTPMDFINPFDPSAIDKE
jgi:hypothetical protein